MPLSSCFQCKNYSEEVCLLGQSYADVFSTIQAMADDQDRQRLASYLANCAYWEESDLSKLFSQDVTLSYHAWSRLAYMKIHNGDQTLFQNLVNAARNVVRQQRQATDSIEQVRPNEPLTASPSQPAANDQPQPESVAFEAPEPTILSQEQEPLPKGTAMVPGNETTSLPPLVEASQGEMLPAPGGAEPVSPASMMPLPAPVALPPTPPPFHPEVIGQPGVPTAISSAADPIEVAMQELWAMATAGHTHNGQELGTIVASNRGSGRIDPVTE